MSQRQFGLGLPIILLLVSACAALGLLATAQTLAQEEWPYRFTVSGRLSARSGEQITYRVEYELVDPGRPQSPAFVFTWPADAAEFVSSRNIFGAPGTLTAGRSDSVRWDFSEASSGATEIVLKISPSFSATMRVGIYVPGTGITHRADSLTTVTTAVEAAGAEQFPGTGMGGDGGADNGATIALISIVLGLSSGLLVGYGLRLATRR